MKPRLRPSRDKTMIDHDTLQQTVPIIGIDLCFSGIQQCHFYPIINNMKIRMRYADLNNADWYWANYGSYTHVVAMHAPTPVQEFLIGDMQEEAMDIGIAIACFLRVTRSGEAAECEGMEFYFPDMPATHSENMLHRIQI